MKAYRVNVQERRTPPFWLVFVPGLLLAVTVIVIPKPPFASGVPVNLETKIVLAFGALLVSIVGYRWLRHSWPMRHDQVAAAVLLVVLGTVLVPHIVVMLVLVLFMDSALVARTLVTQAGVVGVLAMMLGLCVSRPISAAAKRLEWRVFGSPEPPPPPDESDDLTAGGEADYGADCVNVHERSLPPFWLVVVPGVLLAAAITVFPTPLSLPARPAIMAAGIPLALGALLVCIVGYRSLRRAWPMRHDQVAAAVVLVVLGSVLLPHAIVMLVLVLFKDAAMAVGWLATQAGHLAVFAMILGLCVTRPITAAAKRLEGKSLAHPSRRHHRRRVG